jgi:uncharacterized protein YpmS
MTKSSGDPQSEEVMSLGSLSFPVIDVVQYLRA